MFFIKQKENIFKNSKFWKFLAFNSVKLLAIIFHLKIFFRKQVELNRVLKVYKTKKIKNKAVLDFFINFKNFTNKT